jgi:FlaA1/EpsC-like NDP-sugar epimerase
MYTKKRPNARARIGWLGSPGFRAAMSSYELLTKLPATPIAIVLIALGVYVAVTIYMTNRDQKGLAGRILLYSFLAVLFVVDFFLFLKRDGFRASWSLTFWLVLAAFMVGERIGRWTSGFGAAGAADRDPLK